MAKPGAGHSFKPTTAKTYSNKSHPKRASDARSANPLPSPSHGEIREAKRQKIEHGVVDSNSEYSSHRSRARLAYQRTNEYEETNAIIERSKRGNGQDDKTPIELDDEAPSERPSTAKRLQLDQFQQGITGKANGGAGAKGLGTVSRYFTAEIQKTTQSHKQSGQRGIMDADVSQNLRDTFKRSTTERISDSEDELAAPINTTNKQQKSTAKQDIATSRSTSRKIHGLPSGGWELEWARSHAFDPRSGPGLALKRGAGKYAWRVVSTNAEGTRQIGVDLCLSKITSGTAGPTSRIRLVGSRNAEGTQDRFDLQFAHEIDLQSFKNECVNCGFTLVMRDEEWLERAFNKPIGTKPEDKLPMVSPTAPVGPKTNTGKNEGPQKTHIIDALLESRVTKREAVAGPRDVASQRASARTSARPTRTTRANAPSYVTLDDVPDTPIGYSVRVGLGAPWRKQLTYGTGRRRAVIDFSDLARLDEEQFLNDSLIDFYMIYLFNHSKIAADQVYIFNTHFFSTLTRKVPGHKKGINYAGVARWTAKEDLFNYDYIVVPINQDLHWYLAIICNVQNIARKYDEKPSASLEATNEAGSFQGSGPEGAASLDQNPLSTSSLTVEDQGHTQSSENEMLFSDDSKPDLVDADATEENTEPAATPQDNSVGEYIIADTVDDDGHTLANLHTTDLTIHKAASSVLPKKPKRKSGPPPRKCDPDEPCIIIMDSLGNTSRSGAVRALKDYILEEGRARRGMEADIHQNAFYAKGTQIPMQDNYSDCGVYVLGYIQKFFRDPDDFKNRLLTREMTIATDWLDLSVNKMRDDIRSILMNLHSEQTNEYKRARAAQKVDMHVPKNAGVASAKIGSKERMQESKTCSAPTVDADRHESTSHSKQTGVSRPATNSCSKVEYVPQPSADTTPKSTPITTPKLGSPFEPRTTKNPTVTPAVHVAGTSDDVPRTPETTQQEKYDIKDDQGQPSERSARKPSPKVVVRSPSVVSSAKRKHNDVLVDLEVISPRSSKQAAVKVKQTASTIGIAMSPFKKRGRSTTSTKTGNGMRGSSNDPIPIDDSQDTISASPMKTPRKQYEPIPIDDSQDTVSANPTKKTRKQYVPEPGG